MPAIPCRSSDCCKAVSKFSLETLDFQSGLVSLPPVTDPTSIAAYAGEDAAISVLADTGAVIAPVRAPLAHAESRSAAAKHTIAFCVLFLLIILSPRP